MESLEKCSFCDFKESIRWLFILCMLGRLTWRIFISLLSSYNKKYHKYTDLPYGEPNKPSTSTSCTCFWSRPHHLAIDRAIFTIEIHIALSKPTVDATMMLDNTIALCAPIIARPSQRPCCPTCWACCLWRNHTAPPHDPFSQHLLQIQCTHEGTTPHTVIVQSGRRRSRLHVDQPEWGDNGCNHDAFNKITMYRRHHRPEW
jgi:hypothetical protein